LFVVLLVLLSIILTAGVVTFVNRIEPLQTKINVLKEQAEQNKAILNQRITDLDAMTSKYNAAEAAAAAAAEKFQTAIQTERSATAKSDAALAQANNQIAVLSSTMATQSVAVAASEEAKNKLQDQVVALRKDTDERLRQVADLGQRVSKLVAELDATERQRRNLAEQVAELQGKTEQQSRALKDLGYNESQLKTAGTRAGAPAINGIIRSRETIAGREYGKISIGSQDQVTKGMQFQILDKETGAFLGVLTVDVVDAQEAMGHIDADQGKLAQIKAGNVVKTQI
jgi:hypothetical protein